MGQTMTKKCYCRRIFKKINKFGIGEILLNSIDNDGLMKGAMI